MKPAVIATFAVLTAAESAVAAEREISLSESIDRALAKNHEIAVSREAVDVAAANLARADGGYDPSFRLDFHWYDQTEASNFIFSGAPAGEAGPTASGVFGQAAVSELLPTGGTVSLGTSISRDTTNNIFTLLTPSYSTFVGLDLRQPLLQNRSIDPQRRLIRVARLERDRSASSLQAENDRFAAGMTSNFFVLTRQNELAEALRTETAALTGYNKALADYARACGTLLEERHIEFEGGEPAVAAPGGH